MSEYQSLIRRQLGDVSFEIRAALIAGSPTHYQYAVDGKDVSREVYFAVLKTVQAHVGYAGLDEFKAQLTKAHSKLDEFLDGVRKMTSVYSHGHAPGSAASNLTDEDVEKDDEKMS